MLRSKSKGLIFIVLSILLTSRVYYYYRCKIQSDIKQELSRGPAELISFATPDVSINPNIQKKWQATFLQNYLSPWNEPFLHFSKQYIQEQEIKYINKYMTAPGWGMNSKPISKEFMSKTTANMHIIKSFNNGKKAITLRFTHLRVLPTNLPSFANWTDTGEGYPFDYLQEAGLHSYLPIYVIHTTLDGSWSLVITPNKIFGWVSNEDIAYVNNNFIKQWSSSGYATAIAEPIVLQSNDSYAGELRVGGMIPIEKNNADNFLLKIPHKNQDGIAEIKLVTANKSHMTKWPLSASTTNMAKLANELITQPYSWGGILGMRDCSDLMQDLYATVGVWLPKNSGDQKFAGKFIDMSKLSYNEKIKKIASNAVPFYSILWLRGHTSMYVGHNGDNIYTYHSIWGMRTISLTGDDRAIIGENTLMNLNLGRNNPLVQRTVLDMVSGIIMLDSPNNTV